MKTILRTLLTIVLLFGISVGIGGSATFAEELILKKGQLGGDETFVMEFFRSRIEQGNESVEELFEIFDSRFKSFSNEFMLSARGDLNRDGVDELMIQFEHVYSCGSSGCWTHIFRKADRGWTEIGEFSGGDGVEMTDPIIDGWPRLFSAEMCLVWNGAKYEGHFNDPFDMGVDPECRR